MVKLSRVASLVGVMIVAGVGVLVTSCDNSSGPATATETASVTVRPGANNIVAVSPDGGFVLIGDSGTNTVQFVRPDGTVLWKYSLPADQVFESGAMSTDAAIVVIGTSFGKVYALSRDGVLLWEKTISGEVQVAMTRTGNKIFAAREHILTCYSATGGELWSRVIDTRGWTLWQVSVSADGDRMILVTNSDVLFCNGDGVELTFFNIVDGNSVSSAALRGDGTQFAVSYQDATAFRLALYDVGSGELWRQTIDTWSDVRMDDFGNVFETSRGYSNMMYSNAGELLVSWPGGGRKLAVDQNGTVCAVGGHDNVVVYQIH